MPRERLSHGPGSDSGLVSLWSELRIFAACRQQTYMAPETLGETDLFKGLKPILYGGREVWPLVEGGKGVSRHQPRELGRLGGGRRHRHRSARSTPTATTPKAGSSRRSTTALTRRERHEELIQYAIDGAVAQVQRAYEIAERQGRDQHQRAVGNGRRAARAPRRARAHQGPGRRRHLRRGHAVQAVSEIAASYGVNYLPIISSARAFRALWKRAYHKAAEWLAAVVYEDPWLAGGHNGLSNAEDPRKPQDPYPRVKALRETMREGGIADSVPIVMAGGVWRLDEWENWIDNPELGQIVFQFGTRPLLTQESPIPPEWKARLMTLEEGDILLHRFSPTGFYSSAVRNPFLRNLEARSHRQIAFTKEPLGDHHFELDVGVGKKQELLGHQGRPAARARMVCGGLYRGAEDARRDADLRRRRRRRSMIRKDQADCMGCLSQCAFSSWADNEKNSTGRLADPRSFCIQKTLQDIAHGGPVEQNLMFAGHSAFRFKTDPFYSNGFVPTVKQLVDRILTGA